MDADIKPAAELASDAYTREYLDLLESSGTDEADRRNAWRFAEGSGVYWQGHPSYIGFLPRLYSTEMRKRFASIGETA